MENKYIPPKRQMTPNAVETGQVRQSYPLMNKMMGEGLGLNPTYETLPANSSRLAESQLVTSASGNTTVTTLTYTVPDGWVLYLKTLFVNIVNATSSTDPAYNGVPDGTLSVTLDNDRNSLPFNQNIIIQPLADPFNVWMVAAARSTIRVRVAYDFTALPSAPDTVNFITGIAGDMILANNKQPQYTVLNK
jgi:hypothetical protein